MRPSLSALLVFLFSVFFSHEAFSWGKRGHAVICQTAAALASSEPEGAFLKAHAFDLGYYCNVPDLVWKKPATYKVEWTNHFMDLEIFERGMKGSKIEKPFALDRLSFNASFPDIKDEAGRAFWRVRELEELLSTHTLELKQSSLTTEDRHRKQADWLVTAGVLGHYVGDLAQPLHVTENYDGQLTNQKGIHAHFEEKLIDEASAQAQFFSFESEVLRLAARRWPVESKKLRKQTTLELMENLARNSIQELPKLLAADKKVGRDLNTKSIRAHRQQQIDRMTSGALVLAEIWRRQIGWVYNGDKFYTFVAEPSYVFPPAPNSPSSSANSKPAQVKPPQATSPSQTPAPASAPTVAPKAATDRAPEED